MNEAKTLSDFLLRLENKLSIDTEKVHLLGIAANAWAGGKDLRVTDLLELSQRTSRATTHRMIKELVSQKIFQVAKSDEDKRTRQLIAGPKFVKYTEAIGKAGL